MNDRYSFILALPLLILFVIIVQNVDLSKQPATATTHINEVLGDESYVRQFGKSPGPDVSDEVRIRIHLEYVEGLLRGRPVDHLTDEQRENRFFYLDQLRNYYLMAEFPHNDGHPDSRRPAFISEDGNICAVGFLVQQTEGRELAEAINERFKYSYIKEIDDSLFLDWAAQSGFTIKELAMIQPAYGPIITEEKRQNQNYIETSFGAGSALVAGVNSIYFSNRASSPWLFNTPRNNHWFGLASGTGSIILGVLNINNRSSYTEQNGPVICFNDCSITEIVETNHARTGLAAANIGVGLASVIRAGYYLTRGPEKPGESSTVIGVTTIQADPVQHSEPVPALQFSVRF
jgi:hypothetical protein